MWKTGQCFTKQDKSRTGKKAGRLIRKQDKSAKSRTNGNPTRNSLLNAQGGRGLSNLRLLVIDTSHFHFLMVYDQNSITHLFMHVSGNQP
jgi:hypothetical protein